MRRSLIITVLFFVFASPLQMRSQVIISLIFGEKLNSPNIEFGLDGGLSLTTLNGLQQKETARTFNLGLYFDFKFKNRPQWMLNIGEMVIATMGAEQLPVYALNDPQLDTVFKGGSVNRQLSYFNTTVFLKYKFKNNLYVKAGVQACLMNKAFDEFTRQISDEEYLHFENKVKNQYKSIDVGPSLGIGYRLLKGDGINIGIQYYYGMISLFKDTKAGKIYNRCLYITAGIPVGAAKSAKNREKSYE